jgi:glycine reductase
MTDSKVRVVHYLNQFFAGIGGEEQAGHPVEVRPGAAGPGRALQARLAGQGDIVATLIGGDSYVNEQREAAEAALRAALTEWRPDVLVAGPAFNAGRYGLACSLVCRIAHDLGVPAVTGMYPENPGLTGERLHMVAVPTSDRPLDMQVALAAMARLALKLGRDEALGPAAAEGYLPRGLRVFSQREAPGYQRALDMLVAKLNGQPFQTEVPIQVPERVAPAAPIADLRSAQIALVSTGGLIPKGNPERQLNGNPHRYYRYSVVDRSTLMPHDWEAFHGGYFNGTASENPNYICPLRHLRHLEAEGVIGGVFPDIFTMPGVATPVDKSMAFGDQLGTELREGGADGCFLVAT